MKQYMLDTFISPFTWRYGSSEMRAIYSEQNKYKTWRKIWIALAEAQHKAGLVSKKELDDLKKYENDIDIDRILEIEKETRHDVVAAIKEFAEKAKIGGGKIHLGATSMDVVDNGDMMRMHEAIDITEKKLLNILKLFAEKIDQYAKIPCIGFTHLQPAEPTTVGYRFAFYAQDLLIDFEFLQYLKEILQTKGMKGAVGTAASYTALLKKTDMTPDELEQIVMKKIGMTASLISTQVYTRKFDYLMLTAINSIASSIAKFAGDLRILQSPMYGEWSEPFGKKQVGSSAMPFKKNPINSEKICSLARYILMLPNVALENATVSYLERTLDDSSNKRLIIPEAFLALDEILKTAEKIIAGLVVNEKRIAHNLDLYAPFAATETILMESVKKGADRQIMHEVLREISMIAWAEIQEGKPNRMAELLSKDKTIKKYLTGKEINTMLNASDHIGTAPQRSLALSKKIKKMI